VLLADRDMTGEEVRLDARRGIPGMGPWIPEDVASISSTWVGGVQNPFFEWGVGDLVEVVSLVGELTLGGVGTE
jgi:hypothetical protein